MSDGCLVGCQSTCRQPRARSSAGKANCVVREGEEIPTLQQSTGGPNFAITQRMSKVLTLFSRLSLLCLVLQATASGCGGAVDDGGKSGSNPNPSTGSSGGSGCCGNSPGQSLLGDCKPGFSPEEATDAKPCRFFVGKTCYSTQDEACACVCPRDQGSVLCVADGNQYLAGTDAYGVWCEPE